MLHQLSKLCLQRVANAAKRPVLQSDVHLSLAAANVVGPNAISNVHCWMAATSLATIGNFSIPGHRSSSSATQSGYVALNTLRDNPGAVRKGRRLGRGIGSSKGKTAGRGHKGQKSRAGRSPRLGFEGGQTPMRFRVPKKGFHNPFSLQWEKIELRRVMQWVNDGKLDTQEVITMRDLRDSGAVMKRVNKCNGVKLMATGGRKLQAAIHLQVSQATAQARAAVEAAGGSVTTVYYNKLGLRALLDPEWFTKKGRLLPNPARPPPKMETRFDVVGSLPPQTSLLTTGTQKPL